MERGEHGTVLPDVWRGPGGPARGDRRRWSDLRGVKRRGGRYSAKRLHHGGVRGQVGRAEADHEPQRRRTRPTGAQGLLPQPGRADPGSSCRSRVAPAGGGAAGSPPPVGRANRNNAAAMGQPAAPGRKQRLMLRMSLLGSARKLRGSGCSACRSRLAPTGRATRRPSRSTAGNVAWFEAPGVSGTGNTGCRSWRETRVRRRLTPEARSPLSGNHPLAGHQSGVGLRLTSIYPEGLHGCRPPADFPPATARSILYSRSEPLCGGRGPGWKGGR